MEAGSDRPAGNTAGLAFILHRWRPHGSAVETYQFPAEAGLLHDVIDPYQPEQQIDRV